ncbi:hypothetical protein CK203_064935 [Vitis vinifera]|uniref:Uncharacterized protein n=1 Tax=Vitis vinifera TaxID=29760 RepID=A0A438HGM5_VITVI|nr:hypothetical protein CK203_064935 [Vitis vinifera]
MTYSLPAFSVVIKPSFKHSSHKRLQVRAQSYRDEGRSSNMVDANLRVLKERIDVVRMKERLERCCRHEYGWNYASGNDCKLQKDTEFSHLFDLFDQILPAIPCMYGMQYPVSKENLPMYCRHGILGYLIIKELNLLMPHCIP